MQQQPTVQCLPTPAAMTDLRFAAATILQSGLATAETHIDITTQKPFPLPSADLQDEAERIRESNAEEDVIDLPEQERKCTQGLVFVLTIFIH